MQVMVSQEARGDAWASFDGRQRQPMPKGSALIIRTSKYPLPSFCHSDPMSDWFDSLAGCLHWNDRKTQNPFALSPDLWPADSSDAVDSSETDSNGSAKA